MRDVRRPGCPRYREKNLVMSARVCRSHTPARVAWSDGLTSSCQCRLRQALRKALTLGISRLQTGRRGLSPLLRWMNASPDLVSVEDPVLCTSCCAIITARLMCAARNDHRETVQRFIPQGLSDERGCNVEAARLRWSVSLHRANGSHPKR